MQVGRRHARPPPWARPPRRQETRRRRHRLRRRAAPSCWSGEPVMAAVRLSRLQKRILRWLAADAKRTRGMITRSHPELVAALPSAKGNISHSLRRLETPGLDRDDPHARWENRKRLSDRRRSSEGPHTCGKVCIRRNKRAKQQVVHSTPLGSHETTRAGGKHASCKATRTHHHLPWRNRERNWGPRWSGISTAPYCKLWKINAYQ